MPGTSFAISTLNAEPLVLVANSRVYHCLQFYSSDLVDTIGDLDQRHSLGDRKGKTQSKNTVEFLIDSREYVAKSH